MDSPKRRIGLSVLLVDCPFCGKTHFWTILEAPKCVVTVRPSFGVPVFGLIVCVSTFDWTFLLWVVNNHLNKKASRTAIRLCARLLSRQAARLHGTGG